MMVGRTSAWLLLGLALAIPEATGGMVEPASAQQDLNNPHKGFMLWGTDYVDGPPVNHYGATIYHVYMPWRDVETADQVFDWGRFETNHLLPILADHPEATFVIRPVADYPDGDNSGITLFYQGGEVDRDFPRFLIEPPLSIPYAAYTSCDGDGPGWTPDWNASAMHTQLVEFVEAFAAQYDGDPRITAVQVGLLGLWGEWHQSGCDNRAPSNEVKVLVRNAYASGFTRTPLQTRYPRNPDAVGVEFGFHEDYFPSFTAECTYGFPQCDDSGDWSMQYCFDHVTPASVDNWMSNPVSGESPGASQKRTWSNDVADIMTVLRDYHFSFLGPAGGHQWNGNQANLNPMKRLLGYNYHIQRVTWPDTVLDGIPFEVSLVMTNSGAAPCYHPFELEAAFCSAEGAAWWRGTFDVDLRELVPGPAMTVTGVFAVTGFPTGTVSLRIGILDPRTGEPGVRIQSAGEDGNLRIVAGDVVVADPWTTDEDGDELPDGWEYRYFQGITNASAEVDDDGDGQTNLDHYLSGTHPLDDHSYFRLGLAAGSLSPSLELDTITNRVYALFRHDRLDGSWNEQLAPILGTGGAVTIPAAPSNGLSVWRAEVRMP